MRPSTCRPFSILDGMILTAALAVGFGMMRLCWPARWAFAAHGVREWASVVGGVPMLPLTVALVAIRLIRPRQKIERLMCQPGMAACCAAGVVIGVEFSAMVFAAWRIHPFWAQRLMAITSSPKNFWFVYHLPVGPAVAAAWLALVLAGRWRPERGWIDRLGRGIGWFWLVYMFFQWQLGRWTSGIVTLLRGEL